VGVVDTDIQSPGLHILFGLDQSEIRHSLNDYLWGTRRRSVLAFLYPDFRNARIWEC
jgi:MinD-like ATPase involved in chromosome partitioning or flagellar assembly